MCPNRTQARMAFIVSVIHEAKNFVARKFGDAEIFSASISVEIGVHKDGCRKRAAREEP